MSVSLDAAAPSGPAIDDRLLIAITIVAVFTLQPDDNYDVGGPALQRLFGTMPSLWAAWLTIVLGATLPLIPAVIVGWRKHWFRSAWW